MILHASYQSEPSTVFYNDYAADAVTGGGLLSYWIYYHSQWRLIVKVFHLTYHLVVVAAVDAPRLMPAFRLRHLRQLHYPLVMLMKVVGAADCGGGGQWIAVVAASDVAADAYALMVAQLVVVVAVV